MRNYASSRRARGTAPSQARTAFIYPAHHPPRARGYLSNQSAVVIGPRLLQPGVRR